MKVLLPANVWLNLTKSLFNADFEEEEDDPARGKNRGKKKGNLGAANTSAALAELNEYELQ